MHTNLEGMTLQQEIEETSDEYILITLKLSHLKTITNFCALKNKKHLVKPFTH